MDYPLPEWRETYRKWIDLGADAVIASHPHVPQGWEFYKGKPICYSLGNFCFQKDNVDKTYWNDSLCCVINIEADEMSVKMKSIHYSQENQFLSCNDDSEFSKHLENINSVLKDDRTYRDCVDEKCLSLLPKYYSLFSRSGFVSKITTKEFLKGIIEKFKKEHAFNCINCESHRWAIERAMRLKYGIR